MDYSSLVELYEKLFSCSKRLEKTRHISDFLRSIDSEFEIVFLLVKGRVYPDWDESNLGFAAKMALKAISISSGISQDIIFQWWRKLGDLGDVAEKAISKKKQSTLFIEKLTLKKVFDNLRKLSSQQGSGSVDLKIKLVTELLASASSKEAKYIIRLVLEDMRLGIGDSTIRDAIAWSCFDIIKINDKEKDEKKKYVVENRDNYNNVINALQSAYDVANDWVVVFKSAKKGIEELKKLQIQIGKPIKVMLYLKAIDIEDAFKNLGKPCIFEYKYDGFRMQIHKNGSEISIFTRRLDNVTAQFPEIKQRVVENIKAESCILDCEAVGFEPKTKKYLPFQNVSQRIKRKHNINEMLEKLPVELNVFDIIYCNGSSQLNVPFSERRKLLEKITIQSKNKIVLAAQILTDSKEKAQAFFEQSLKSSNEGLMAKKLDGIYKPGARVGYGMKIKSILEPLDLVIVRAEYGEGKRAGWLSSFTLACIDEDGSFLEIGKVSTGLKEKEEQGVSFIELTNLLKPLVLSESNKQVDVKPSIIIEVGYEEIQKSSSYSSGFALRFPRFLRLREDKHLSEISSIDYIERLFRQQNK